MIKLVIHGGAGEALRPPTPDSVTPDEVRSRIRQHAMKAYQVLVDEEDAMKAVLFACRLLEDDPVFNAGTGSILQEDGEPRVAASIMNGKSERFSAVLNGTSIRNPIDLAGFLQGEDDRVLSESGILSLASDLGVPAESLKTEWRVRQWREGAASRRPLEGAGCGTIGAVALDQSGVLVAGTSTGGRGMVRVGRVSDSGTPAGNYATSRVAISCTGHGEDIMELALAARVAVRVEDGWSVGEALGKSLEEAQRRSRSVAAICLGADGAHVWGTTTGAIVAACVSAEGYEFSF